MLLIDGIKYELWSPPSEDDFEREVKVHAVDLFGEKCSYFDKKQKLKSLAGIGSIPDGLAIILGEPPEWHIVEFELSNHDVYGHIVSQVSKFINGLTNFGTRQRIAKTIYDEVTVDPLLKLRIEQAIQSKEIFKFITELVDSKPFLTIIVEKKTDELHEAITAFSYPNIRDVKVIEFQTFIREGIGLAVHVHLFEPVVRSVLVHSLPSTLPPTAIVSLIATPSIQALEITIQSPTYFKFHLFNIPKKKRQFFPGYKVPFILETDMGEITTHVSSAKAGTLKGDPNAGYYIQSGLADWYRRHPTLRIGDKVTFEVIESMKRYRLKILK